MRPFRYGLEPLSLAACALYAANRWLMKPLLASPFLRGHFNDLLLIPCALPLVLWLHAEISLHLAMWTLIAEWIGPHWLHRGVGDWWDVGAYTLGAVIAAIAWRSFRTTAQ
jgi:hypothetical protein